MLPVATRDRMNPIPLSISANLPLRPERSQISRTSLEVEITKPTPPCIIPFSTRFMQAATVIMAVDATMAVIAVVMVDASTVVDLVAVVNVNESHMILHP